MKAWGKFHDILFLKKSPTNGGASAILWLLASKCDTGMLPYPAHKVNYLSHYFSPGILNQDMSELSPAEIDHLAKLARLTLSDVEKEKFAKQLPEILSFVDQLSAITKSALASSEQTAPVPLAKLRPDEESSTRLSLADLKTLAPAWQNSQLEVPAVFGQAADD